MSFFFHTITSHLALERPGFNIRSKTISFRKDGLTLSKNLIPKQEKNDSILPE